MSDPAYLARVSTAMADAVAEAHDLAARGETGAPLTQILRHARELHEILVDELAEDDVPVRQFADGALIEMGNRLRTLEQYLNAH